jgi:hypothetical protein
MLRCNNAAMHNTQEKEMSTPAENLERMKEMASDGYESARQLGDINLRTWNNFAEKQMGMFHAWLDFGVRQSELSTAAKDPKAYLASQVALTRDMAEKMMASGRDAVSSGGEVQGEYRDWYEKSVQSMVSNWNMVGKQAS